MRELESIHFTEGEKDIHTCTLIGQSWKKKQTNTGNVCVLLFWKKKTSLITISLSSAAWTHCVWDSRNLGAFESACICFILRRNTLFKDHQQRAVIQSTATSRSEHPNIRAKGKQVSFCFGGEPIYFFLTKMSYVLVERAYLMCTFGGVLLWSAHVSMQLQDSSRCDISW